MNARGRWGSHGRYGNNRFAPRHDDGYAPSALLGNHAPFERKANVGGGDFLSDTRENFGRPPNTLDSFDYDPSARPPFGSHPNPHHPHHPHPQVKVTHSLPNVDTGGTHSRIRMSNPPTLFNTGKG